MEDFMATSWLFPLQHGVTEWGSIWSQVITEDREINPLERG